MKNCTVTFSYMIWCCLSKLLPLEYLSSMNLNMDIVNKQNTNVLVCNFSQVLVNNAKTHGDTRALELNQKLSSQ